MFQTKDRAVRKKYLFYFAAPSVYSFDPVVIFLNVSIPLAPAVKIPPKRHYFRLTSVEIVQSDYLLVQSDLYTKKCCIARHGYIQ